MNGLAFLRERTQTRTSRIVFCILCLFPLVSGVIGHLIGRLHGTFMDVDAVLCAAQAEAVGASPYGVLPCSGPAPSAYVYAPQVAAGFVPLIHALGVAGVRWAYILFLFFPALALLLWYALRRPVDGVDWRVRMLAVSGLAPMVFCSGNFGVVMHALVISSLLFCSRRRWVFVAVVLLCVVIKPTFLMYLLVPLFEARPWRQRWVALAVSGAAGFAVLVVTALTAGPLAAQWRQALGSVALRDQPGLGWLALTTWLHMVPDAPVTLVLTLVFMASMAACGVAIAEAAGLDDGERRVLALGLVPLLTPRLMDYDMLALVPCMALLMRVLPVLGRRIYCYNMSWLFVGGLGLGIVTNLLHLSRQWPRSQVAMALFCLVVLAGGARLALKEWEKRREPREREKREMATLGGPLHVRRGTGGEDARREVAGKLGN